jgi:protein disulfide-isomerase
MGTKMQVEVWSDIMCPFCYIGKRHYEKALSEFAHKNEVEIVWKSFQLDPESPEHYSKSVDDYLSERKGINREQAAAMNAQVSQMAKNAGLEYHLGKAVISNSFKAHRLIQFAKTRGLGDAIEERLFHAYFTEGKNFGDAETLTALGKEVGLTEAEIHEALTNDEYAYRVKQDIQEAQNIGVRGVPFFVFNRRYAISGAQPAEVFLETLEKSFVEWRKENPEMKIEIAEGAVCTPDGSCQTN